mgnify:CR=1 FL=1
MWSNEKTSCERGSMKRPASIWPAAHTITYRRTRVSYSTAQRLLAYLVVLAGHIDRRELLHVVLLDGRGHTALQEAIVADKHTNICANARQVS